MAAYDSYSGKARCPNCGDWLWLGGQTQFFDPDMMRLGFRWLQPGSPQ